MGVLGQLNHTKGQTLVEFALLLPVMAIMLLAAMYMGLFLFNLHETASKTRSLHKNMEKYADSSQPKMDMQGDLGGNYKVEGLFAQETQAGVAQVTREFSIPLSFVPGVTIVSSTAFPAKIFKMPMDSPSMTTGLPNDYWPKKAIEYAQTLDLYLRPMCVDMSYCFGINLLEGPDTKPFYHLNGDIPRMPVSVVLMDGDNCRNPGLGAFAEDKYGEQDMFPQCHAAHNAGELTDREWQQCLGGKLTNAEEYVKKHIEIMEKLHGCEGEPIVGTAS